MTAEQLELAFMAVGCGFATLVGFSVIDIGPDTPKVRLAKRLLRRSRPWEQHSRCFCSH